MKNINLFSKIFLLISVISGSLWFGSYLARLTATYQMFQGNYFNLNYYITQQNLPGILTTITALLLLTGILFTVFIVTYFIFLISSKLSLKENGWLFVITMIILVTLPFEIYLMTIDYKIYLLISNLNFNATDVLSLYIKRLKILSGFPIIEMLCYASIIFFSLFQPLKRKLKR